MSRSDVARPLQPPEQAALGREWRSLSRAATVVALMTAPAFFVVLSVGYDWPLGWSLLATILGVIAFRGLVDVIAHRLIPRPSMYGADREALEDDALGRRRAWFWRGKYRILFWVALTLAVLMLILGESLGDTLGELGDAIVQIAPTLLILPLLLPDQLRDPVRADAGVRAPADEGIRARRRRLGRAAGGRARPDRAQGGGHPRHPAVAVGRRVPQGGRQARARPAVHRLTGHRQDDALQGDRHVVQLADRDDARLGLRADVHRHGRHRRALPDPQGAQARAQVGRPVHHLHRRDRRRRPAPPGAGQQLPADAGLRGHLASTARGARRTPAAT